MAPHLDLIKVFEIYNVQTGRITCHGPSLGPGILVRCPNDLAERQADRIFDSLYQLCDRQTPNWPQMHHTLAALAQQAVCRLHQSYVREVFANWHNMYLDAYSAREAEREQNSRPAFGARGSRPSIQQELQHRRRQQQSRWSGPEPQRHLGGQQYSRVRVAISRNSNRPSTGTSSQASGTSGGSSRFLRTREPLAEQSSPATLYTVGDAAWRAAWGTTFVGWDDYPDPAPTTADDWLPRPSAHTYSWHCSGETHSPRRPIAQDQVCAICLSRLWEPAAASPNYNDLRWCKDGCGQNFHRQCINSWIGTTNPDAWSENGCPTCRKKWASGCHHDLPEEVHAQDREVRKHGRRTQSKGPHLPSHASLYALANLTLGELDAIP
ncbi:hypothetical protein BT63DRAFT_484314 [Microthyrium microscopicum]|uniref:RING-type domain-containing protein n=1 Tax=Microthyrium microscopicum TaxID=703497 RepID=A0A6A6TWR1_9PEZI|nr:hypothetical protein BT63DRAFT_484314 [Microthyrium microscopicum]